MGEFDFIAWIRSQQKAGGLVVTAAGDDLAVLKWPADELLLMGVDQVLDGVHFDTQVHSPREIGRKVMNRNLSDCAAMACLPAAAVATVALPEGVGIEYAKELYLGLKEAADPFGCAIVGGDTASWAGKLAVTVSILGRSGGIEPVRRSGATAGEGIYVTGALGGSILGRHMNFRPRVELARRLAEGARVSAMIDISDGLSRDLRQICGASGVGAVIDAEKLPIHRDARTLSHRDGRSALEHALHDGEDHELLFCSQASGLRRLGAIRVGQTVAEPGVWICDEKGVKEELRPGGWEHRL
ncbi:MAG TPA: thiamine-phosphate kinase [Tepidisphaeraceae bacterium]|jgi:thiamine-monophosphate kinase|nr:thiamine-phosphate kinase [Tepidisphaeraceae bacterium]